MILHAPNLLVIGCIGSILDGGSGCDATESRWQLGDGVTVRHPHLTVLGKSLQQRIACLHEFEIGTTVLTRALRFHLASEGVGHELGTVADAEDGILATNLVEVELEGTLLIDAVGRTRQDDANHVGVILRKFVVRHDFAERVELTHTASDQLRSL